MCGHALMNRFWILIWLCALTQAAHGAVYFFPQTADGVAGNQRIRTHFVVTNLGQTQAAGLFYFHVDDGSQWMVDLRCDERPELSKVDWFANFTLAPMETVRFYTAGSGALKVGWTQVQTEPSVVISSAYSAFDNNAPVWEAGVLPADLSTEFSFGASYTRAIGVAGQAVDTGIAICNPGGGAAEIVARLYARSGGTLISEKTLAVPAGGHTGRFLTEIFSDVLWPDALHTVVRISSSVNISVVAMRMLSVAGKSVASTVSVEPDSLLKREIQYDLEPNDTDATAQYLRLPAEVHGTLRGSTGGWEADCYQVNLRPGEWCYVLVLADFTGVDVDAEIVVRDAASQTIASNSSMFAHLRDPFVVFQGPASSDATFYIAVFGPQNTTSETGYRMFVCVKDTAAQ
jgi:hypothetical protein